MGIISPKRSYIKLFFFFFKKSFFRKQICHLSYPHSFPFYVLPISNKPLRVWEMCVN